MNTHKLILLSSSSLALGVTLLFAPHAMAADEKSNLNAADTRFIQNEVAAGNAMLKMAELAEQKAQREDVKAFAAKLVTDHNKANAELTTFAADKSVELTKKADAKNAKHQDMQNKLDQTSPADFDKAFIAMMITDHKKVVKNFEKASTDSKDSDVKAWAAMMLPVQQEHLLEAERLGSESKTNDVTTTSRTSATNSPTTKADNANRTNADLADRTNAGTTSDSTVSNQQSTEPDNTARNERDRDDKSMTPFDQGNSKADINTTAEIRKAIVATDGLSINAQNVKIITNESRVTLRGPVDSEDEKLIVGEIATRVSKSDKIDNKLEVRTTAAVN